MRPTLADYMRNNALKMESAELAPVTEIVAPVTIPDGVEERSRDHLILLPSPGVASSVQVGLGEGDAFEPLTEEQIGVSTVDGDATTASAIVVRDRKLAGELRIRYAPVDVAMEDGDKPFVQLGTVVEPGSENKNPYPANAPTEEAAPQVTNQPTVNTDKGDLEDKAKIAENAVDQSVAPKVEVTVVEKAPETNNQDAGEVVDANDGNTGERKAEEAAKETELKGPKEEEETQDNAVNSNGEDPAQAAAEVEQEQKNDEAEASTENGNDEGSEENTDVTEGEEEEEEEEDGKDEELKQESFNIIADINALATPLVMEDADASSNILVRLWEKLLAQMTKIRTYITEKIFGKAASEIRDQRIEEADVIVTVWKDMPEEVKEDLTSSGTFVYSAGVRDMKEYAANADKYINILTSLRDEASKVAKAALTAMMNDGNNAEGEIQKHVDACAALLKKYNIDTLFPSTNDKDDEAFDRVFETVDKQIAPFHVEIKDFTDEDVRKGVVDCREYLKHVRAKLGSGYHGVGSDILDAKAGAKRFAKSNSAEIRALIGVINELWMYVHGASKMVAHTEVAAKRFIRDVGRKLRTEGKAPNLDENKEQEEELTQLSFQIEADLNATSTGYVAEDGDKKGFFARAWETLTKFIAKVKAWLNDKIFSKFGKKKREAELEEAKKLAAALKAMKELKEMNLKDLSKRYTAGIRDLKKYAPLMTQLSTLATEALGEADALAKEGYMALNGSSGSVERVQAVNTKFEAWRKKFNIATIFGDGDSADTNTAALNKELRGAFQTESGGQVDFNKLRATVDEITVILTDYTKKLDQSNIGTTTSLKSTLAVTNWLNEDNQREHAQKLIKNISDSLAYIVGSLVAAQIIEDAMKKFVRAGELVLAQDGKKEELKTEGFSQPVEIMSAPTDVSPVVIPAEKQFLPDSLVVTRVTDEDQLVILREDKVRVRTNEAGLGEAIVVVDPALQGQIQANYEAVVSGELPAMESDEDPVVTLDVITDDRDGVEIRVAQMVDGDTEEAIPEELVELRAEGTIALEAHENCIKGLSSMAYMVDMANSIQFEGDVQAAELVMEGMLDSIKGAMTRLGNWLDKSMKYQKVWDINWNQALAGVQKEIRNARSGTAKADVVKLNRVVRNLTINGAPVTDFRELQRQLAEIAKLGNDAKAHMVAVGNLYEDVRRLIAKHDNVNPDGAAILKEIPALVKKVNLRPWASLVKGERQVSEKSVERVPTSAPFLGDVVVAERQSLNDLTYANPDKALRAMLEKTYVGYRTDWELDRDLTSAEMSVLSPQDMEALLNSLRKASEAWDLYSTIVATGKKMDAFYRSLWSLKQYDRDFLSAYGVIIAADQWAYHPVLDLRFDLAYPMQAVLRLININCAVYK